jgi:hypothetical protein
MATTIERQRGRGAGISASRIITVRGEASSIAAARNFNKPAVGCCGFLRPSVGVDCTFSDLFIGKLRILL